jgi:Raf kinase inhibitor-like YbhB/YbcL family protein
MALTLAGCATSIRTEVPPMTDTLTVSSSAFAEGEVIPAKYGCDGSDVSPPLAWSGAPSDAAGYAVIVDDPDAGGFIHWIGADMPAGTTGIEEGNAAGTEGRNDFGRSGYGGPCPPSGSHRYEFTVYALSAPTDLPAGFSADDLRTAIEGKVLATGRLSATYMRGAGS